MIQTKKNNRSLKEKEESNNSSCTSYYNKQQQEQQKLSMSTNDDDYRELVLLSSSSSSSAFSLRQRLRQQQQRQQEDSGKQFGEVVRKAVSAEEGEGGIGGVMKSNSKLNSPTNNTVDTVNTDKDDVDILMTRIDLQRSMSSTTSATVLHLSGSSDNDDSRQGREELKQPKHKTIVLKKKENKTRSEGPITVHRGDSHDEEDHNNNLINVSFTSVTSPSSSSSGPLTNVHEVFASKTTTTKEKSSNDAQEEEGQAKKIQNHISLSSAAAAAAAAAASAVVTAIHNDNNKLKDHNHGEFTNGNNNHDALSSACVSGLTTTIDNSTTTEGPADGVGNHNNNKQQQHQHDYDDDNKMTVNVVEFPSFPDAVVMMNDDDNYNDEYDNDYYNYYQQQPTTKSNINHLQQQQQKPIVTSSHNNRSSSSSQLAARNANIDFWKSKVKIQCKRYGYIDYRCANSLIELGLEMIQAEECETAFTLFEESARILKELATRNVVVVKNNDKNKTDSTTSTTNNNANNNNNNNNNNSKIISKSHYDGYRVCDLLKLAKSYELIGYAGSCCYSSTNKKFNKLNYREYCIKGLDALEECFVIRYENLGSQNIDTIETLNKIAGLHMKMKWFGMAYIEYMEVLTLRKYIFGINHPSIAIVERSLGAICIKLHNIHDARQHYSNALRIFYNMGYNDYNHPFVKQVKNKLKQIGFQQSRMEL